MELRKPFDWDDLRVFLAVARSGGFTAASQRVGLDLSTAARRIDRLEEALGLKLFDRYPTGVALTPQGISIFVHAERVEARIVEAADRLSDQAEEPAGPVRITTPEELGTGFVVRHIERIRQVYPRIRIELLSGPRLASLAKREADIQIAPSRANEEGLEASRLMEGSLGLYASPTYLAQRGMPASAANLAAHGLILPVAGDLQEEERDRLERTIPAGRVALRCSSSTARVRATIAGCGVGLLHRFSAANDPRLLPVLPALTVPRTYWIACRAVESRVHRIRAVMALLQELARPAPAESDRRRRA